MICIPMISVLPGAVKILLYHDGKFLRNDQLQPENVLLISLLRRKYANSFLEYSL